MSKSDAKVVELRPAATSAAPTHSESRTKLAGLIDSKLATEAKIQQLSDAAVSLREATDAEGNARAALCALEAERSQAMEAWSKNPSGPMPKFDKAQREELKAVLEDATERASAARIAASAINDQYQREAADLNTVNQAVELAVAAVLIEEIEPKVAAFQAGLRDLAETRAEIIEGTERIKLIGAGLQKPLSDKPNFEVAQPIFLALEDLNKRIHSAFAAPAATGNHHAAFKAFAEKLRRNPMSRLGD